MEVTEELIGKFFRQECTPEECSAVSAFFQQHPDKLDQYLSEQDWQKFDAYQPLQTAASQHMLNNIQEEIHRQQFRYPKLYVYSAVAACLLLLAGVAFWITPNSKLSSYTKNIQRFSGQAKYNDTVYNAGAQDSLLHLQDGSVVTLSPQSQIIYAKHFVQKYRNVYLTGSALFEVAKDKKRPFTVFAGKLSTTALGTHFKVSAMRNSTKTIVQLYSGKVLVRMNMLHSNGAVKGTILEPGQQLMLNRKDLSIQVTAMPDTTNKAALKVANILWVNDHTVKFQNHPLSQVINALQKVYHIHIKANNTELENRYFTGTVDAHKQSSEEVLNTIAMLNRFTLEKHNDFFVLRK